VKLSISLLTAVSTLVLCFILVLSKSTAGLVIQFLLGKLTYSTSNAAALFMLAMCSLGLLISALQFRPGKLSNFAISFVPLALIAGYILHGSATAYYLIHLDLPFGPYFFHWRDGANSYTSPFHSHLGKVAIDFSAERLNLRSVSGQYDMGGVFKEVVSDSFALTLAFCFLFGSIAALTALPAINLRYAGNRALPILYLVCSTAALKNVLDGGFLAQPAPVASVVLAFLSKAQSTAHLRALLKKFGLSGALVIVLAVLPLIISSGEGPLPNLTELLIAVAVMGLVLSLSINHKIDGWAGLAGIYLLAAIIVDANFNLLPLLQPLKPGSKIVQVETASLLPYNPENQVSELYRELGDSPVKASRLLIDNNQKPGSRELLYYIKPLVIDGKKGSFIKGPAFASLSFKQVSGLENWFVLYARISEDLPPARVAGFGDVISRNNAYVYTHAIARMLTNGGFSEFIMMPATSTNPIPTIFSSNSN
jgi:hypothetical protein